MEPIGLGVAIVLGAVQGATEFLPVSSDGHLAIAAFLFEVPDMSLTMVVLLHAGTLLATVLGLGGDIMRMTRASLAGITKPREYLASDSGKLVIAIVAASIPTAVIGLLLENRVEDWAHSRAIVGACLLGSAVAVASTRRGGGSKLVLGIPAAMLVGVAQGLAVLPGLSRSACTIACAMLLGLTPQESFRFSFLLSIPAVGGAVLLKIIEPGALASLELGTLLGAIVAFVVGYGALRMLREMVGRGRLWTFALYLVPLGLAMIVWDVMS